MKSKYTVAVVAYKDVTEEIEKKISDYSIRMIDDVSDLTTFCNYGRNFDQDARACIYLEWYQKNILKYLGMGYKVVLLEIPFNSNQPIIDALRAIDEELGEHLLVIEHDDV